MQLSYLLKEREEEEREIEREGEREKAGEREGGEIVERDRVERERVVVAYESGVVVGP